jgi:hypothetical protein
MDTTPPTTAAILYGAADHLSRHGWHQGGLRPYTGTITVPPPLCAGSAISVAAHGNILSWLFDTDPAASSALAYFAQHITLSLTGAPWQDPAGIVSQWNDDPLRTADEVITALRAAAKQWETEHATTTL